jgi:hypothetical protein
LFIKETGGVWMHNCSGHYVAAKDDSYRYVAARNKAVAQTVWAKLFASSAHPG